MLKKKIMEKFLDICNQLRLILKMNIKWFKQWTNNNKKNKIVEGFFNNFRVLLSENEVNDLRNGLKAKWVEINKKYQTLTHKFIDTIGLKRAKEDCEKDLK